MRREQGRFFRQNPRRQPLVATNVVPRSLGCDTREGLRPGGRVSACGSAPKRAVMAVAHSMFIIAYTMLKTGHNYQEVGGSYLDQINRDQLQQYSQKRLERIGFTVNLAPVA